MGLRTLSLATLAHGMEQPRDRLPQTRQEYPPPNLPTSPLPRPSAGDLVPCSNLIKIRATCPFLLLDESARQEEEEGIATTDVRCSCYAIPAAGPATTSAGRGVSLKNSFRSLKNSKAPGPDNIRPDYLKYLPLSGPGTSSNPDELQLVALMGTTAVADCHHSAGAEEGQGSKPGGWKATDL